MPVTQEDVDANPELSVFVMRQTSALLCENLRRLAALSRNYPHLTPEQALNDAAMMFDKSLETMITRFGGRFSPLQH